MHKHKPIGYYILDFYCADLLLGIELDGEIQRQNKEYDVERDEYLKSCGITVIRFKNEEVLESWDNVKAEIKRRIRECCKNPN